MRYSNAVSDFPNLLMGRLGPFLVSDAIHLRGFVGFVGRRFSHQNCRKSLITFELDINWFVNFCMGSRMVALHFGRGQVFGNAKKFIFVAKKS